MIESEDDRLFLKNLYLNEYEQLGGKLLIECKYSENKICIFTQNVFVFFF